MHAALHPGAFERRRAARPCQGVYTGMRTACARCTACSRYVHGARHVHGMACARCASVLKASAALATRRHLERQLAGASCPKTHYFRLSSLLPLARPLPLSPHACTIPHACAIPPDWRSLTATHLTGIHHACAAVAARSGQTFRPLTAPTDGEGGILRVHAALAMGKVRSHYTCYRGATSTSV